MRSSWGEKCAGPPPKSGTFATKRYSPRVEWVIAILVLSGLIVIHEGGHYVCARIGGMHVDRFSVLGIGPVVVKLFTWKGTEFVISAIPFGAYVHIVGMEAEDETDEEGNPVEPPPAPQGYRNFRDSPLWARVLAIAGGPLANYVTAMIICIGVFGTLGMKVPQSVSISDFGDESPAAEAGLRLGDEFVSVAGQDVRGDAPDQKLNEVTNAHLGETVDITVKREGEEVTVPVKLNEEGRALAISLAPIAQVVPLSPVAAVKEGAYWPYWQTARQLNFFYAMITRKTSGRVGGPVAIVKAIKTSSETGIHDLLMMAALISTALGMFNLLPLPALDGGRLIFLFHEAIMRRRVNPRVEEKIHLVGILGLFALIGWATVGDVRGSSTNEWKQRVTEVKGAITAAEADAARETPAAKE